MFVFVNFHISNNLYYSICGILSFMLNGRIRNEKSPTDGLFVCIWRASLKGEKSVSISLLGRFEPISQIEPHLGNWIAFGRVCLRGLIAVNSLLCKQPWPVVVHSEPLYFLLRILTKPSGIFILISVPGLKSDQKCNHN